jgi:enolase
MKILDIKAIEILDSRGNPTLEVKVILEDGCSGVFKVPSGASTGIHEAHELRDGEKRYLGKGVQKAIKNINTIKDELMRIDFNQEKLDRKLIEIDGSDNKEILGANAILGISCAFARASAKYFGLPLYEYLYRILNNIDLEKKEIISRKECKFPYLFSNVINGGLHAGNDLMVQEFMLISLFEDLEERVRSTSEVYHNLKKLISNKYGSDQTALGDEGGFAPNISTPYEALDLLTEAVKNSGYEGKFAFALDAAASDFYNSESKTYEIEKGKKIDYKSLTNYYNDLISKYPLISIEDPFAEDDFEAFCYFRSKVIPLKNNNPLNHKKEILIVGDDLLVTNPKRIKMAIEKNLCNSLLLKINQIGTLTESLEAFKLVNNVNYHTIVSHRSGETSDNFISDLSFALSNSIKLGAPARSDRTSKYNRLLEIYYNF